ncbi:MAG: response regulator [Gammaproteobacteria bacterium]
MSYSNISFIETRLAALRDAYLRDLAHRLREVDRLWYMLAGPNWQGIHAQDLHRLLHNLAGSGATFGLDDVSQAARKLEQKFKAIIRENRTASAQEREEMAEGFRELDQAVSAALDARPAIARPQAYPGAANEHVVYLLSDDTEAPARYRDELAGAGFTIESFSTSRAFLTKVKRHLPRAVIIDVVAPEKSFTDLPKLYQVLGEGQRVPPVLYTSMRSDIETRLTALKVGARRFFTKPINFPKLIETLKGLTEQVPREPYRLLIIDAVESQAAFYASILEATGMETRVINNPFYALTELDKFLPDLVLMDVDMEECSGIELAAVIRQDDKYAEMPIVFLSAESARDKKVLAMAYGGDEFLTKDITPEDLIAAVHAKARRSRWLGRLRSELQSALQQNERQKIEIQRKEERLKRSQRYSNIGTWDWHIKTGDIYWSERVMPLYGYAEGEVMIRYEDFIAMVHPDDRASLTDAMRQCIEHQQEYEIEHRVIWPDQSVHWLLERGDVQRDAQGEALHMLGVVQDITSRKAMEHALSEQKSLLSMLQYGLSQYVSAHSIYDTGAYMLDGLLDVTESEYGFIGEVRYDAQGQACLETHVMNNTAWALTPTSASPETTAAPAKGKVPIRGPLAQVLRRVIESGKSVMLSDAELQDAARQPASVYPLPESFAAVPIFFGSTLVGVYGLANRPQGYDDSILEFLRPFNATYGVIINAYRLTEQEWHIKADLQIAKDAAERANKAKSDFLNHMSHELRTPLNAILGFGQLMEVDNDHPLSETQRDYLQEIMKAGQHLLALIDEVLDLGKIEAGKMPLSLEAVYLPEIVDECRSLIEPLAAQSAIELKFNNAACLDVWLQADRMRLKQILLNLLSNAIKYNRPGGHIRFDCELAARDAITLSICDTGVGISADKLAQLFEAFERLGAEDTDVEGTGIGLMISRHMVELMGGQMTVRSKPGEGSCFAFTVPLSQTEAL